MTNNTGCTFCKTGIKGLLCELPSQLKNDTPILCKRGIYEDAYCVGTLTPEQYTRGHTLLVLKNHRADITDPNISSEELLGFITAIHKVTNHLKNKARNDRGEPPSRIHVLSLCDGIKHLHAHL
jgi:diadenosine tetraphosphate (Ap4A) HIT family hydrolase